jgi:hypothetical protein
MDRSESFPPTEIRAEEEAVKEEEGRGAPMTTRGAATLEENIARSQRAREEEDIVRLPAASYPPQRAITQRLRRLTICHGGVVKVTKIEPDK